MNFDIILPAKVPAVPVIVHVPHASRFIPPGRKNEFILSQDQLDHELNAMTDHFTDEMAQSATLFGATLFINRMSRLVCDPERFDEDPMEPAAKYGMGTVYTKTHHGQPLRSLDFEATRRQEILEEYYYPYHQAFSNLIDHNLAEFGQVWIIDLHSYPSCSFPFEDNKLDRPDICIGYDDFHKPEGWTEWWRKSSRVSRHLAVGHNTPFAGSFVPLPHYLNDTRVKSLMVELRRDGYMDEATGEKMEYHSFGTRLFSFFKFACLDAAYTVR